MIGYGGLASGISSSTTYTKVNGIKYVIKLDDFDRPTYDVAIAPYEIYESAPIYKDCMDWATKLDTIIQKIVAQNNSNQ